MAKRGNGEGSIYQRESDKRWVGSISLGWKADGKRDRKIIYGKTRAEVAHKMRAELSRKDKNLPIITDNQTVEQFLNDWIKNEIKPNKAAKTYEQYESITRIHLIPALGKHKLLKLGPEHVRAMLNAKKDAGLSDSTRKSIRAILRIALNQAVAWDRVGRNVAVLVDAPEVIRDEVTPWSREEADAFLAVAKKDRLGALFSVAMALGLRKGEALGLGWDDVDFDAARITVRQQLQRTKEHGLRLKPFTKGKKVRRVPIPEPILLELKAHRTKQREERLLAGARWRDSGRVFTTTIGTFVEPTNVNKHFARLVAAAKVPHQRFHDQRHWCATLLLSMKVPVRMVMEILGHAQISTLMSFYGHVLEEDKGAAADAMGSVFEGFGKAKGEEEKTA